MLNCPTPIFHPSSAPLSEIRILEKQDGGEGEDEGEDEVKSRSAICTVVG